MTSFWTGFDHDPRHADNAGLRASDGDRDRVRDLLSTAYAEGRLNREEFDERAEQVASSKKLGDLPAIVNDLVARTPAVRGPGELRLEAERRYRTERREAFFQFLFPSLICWGIWIGVLAAGNGTWFPWPIFVSGGTGIHFVRLVSSREDSIASIQRGLERKQAKALESKKDD